MVWKFVLFCGNRSLWCDSYASLSLYVVHEQIIVSAQPTDSTQLSVLKLWEKFPNKLRHPHLPTLWDSNLVSGVGERHVHIYIPSETQTWSQGWGVCTHIHTPCLPTLWDSKLDLRGGDYTHTHTYIPPPPTYLPSETQTWSQRWEGVCTCVNRSWPNLRASLVPAAMVLPAPLVYTNVAAVKKLIVRVGASWHVVMQGLWHCYVCCAAISTKHFAVLSLHSREQALPYPLRVIVAGALDLWDTLQMLRCWNLPS